MSTYLRMWDEVKKLKMPEAEEWLKKVSPPVGKNINFNGVEVLDVDLCETLKNVLD